MAFLTGQRLTADLLNQNFQGTTTAVVTSSATYTTPEVVVATWTAPVVLGQTYGIIADFAIHSATVGSPSLELTLARIREDNLTGNQLQGMNIPILTAAGGGSFGHVYAEYAAVSTTTKTFVLTAVRNGGAGIHNLQASSSAPCLFRVQPLVN